MSRNISHRITALERRGSPRSGWDYSQLSDGEIEALIRLHLHRLDVGSLSEADQRRFDHLDGLVIRRGKRRPFEHLSDEDLNRRIAELAAPYRAGAVDAASTP